MSATLSRTLWGIIFLFFSSAVYAQEQIPSWFLHRTVFHHKGKITVDSFLTARRAHNQYVVFIIDEVSNIEDQPRLPKKAARIIRGYGDRARLRTDRVKVFFYLLVDPPDSVLIREYFRIKRIPRGLTLLDISPLANNPLLNHWDIRDYPFYLAFNYRKEIVYAGTSRHELIRKLTQQ